MADDIDDLLDEVETKFVNNPCRSSEKRCQENDDLDQVLAEIGDVQEPSSPSFGKQIEKQESVIQSNHAEKKCFPVYLGNSKSFGNSFNKRICDKLRCTSCDFKVIWFEDFRWDSLTTYLFLRNNVPDFGKLKARLLPTKGSRAYCCQCSWKTVSETVMELKDAQLKWVCSKH